MAKRLVWPDWAVREGEQERCGQRGSRYIGRVWQALERALALIQGRWDAVNIRSRGVTRSHLKTRFCR